MLRLNTITGQVAAVDMGVSNLVNQIGDFSNTVVNPLAMLTNQMVNVVAPSLTNILAMTSNIYQNTSADQARILNRPTTVELGSTNTILYKTSPSLDFGRVTVRAEGEGDGVGIDYTMTETTPGVGVYSYDLIADWGLGTYTITCKDPNATDSMIIEVVTAGADTIAGLAQSIADIEKKMNDMSTVMQQINDSGLDSLADRVTDIVSGGGGGGSLSSTIASLENAIAGGSDDSLLSKVNEISRRVNDVSKDSSDAAIFSRNARDYSENALNILKKLKTSDKDDKAQVKSDLDAIKNAVNAANQNINSIPKAIGASALQAQMRMMAKQISDMAKREGYDYTVAGGGAAEDEAETGANEEMITDLNQNMTEMKVSLEFLQKLLKEETNKAIVQEDWLGVE
jgi:uncharacterized coiled-coil protein SlyX